MKIIFILLASGIIIACTPRFLHEQESAVNRQQTVSSARALLKDADKIVEKIKLKEQEGPEQELLTQYQQDYLNTRDSQEKCQLIAEIAKLYSTNSSDFFIRALADSSPQIRQEAAIQMHLYSMADDPKILNALIIALGDNDDDVLIEVIEAISIADDQQVLSVLSGIAKKHSDAMIRAVASDYVQRFEWPQYFGVQQ